MHKLMVKAQQTWKKDGIKALVQKTMEYTKYQMSRKKGYKLCADRCYRAFTDILFINGCDSSVPHPARYRVTHQREQLEANNISTDEVYYLQLRPEMVKYSHVFLFFRCPYTPEIGTFIKLAHQLHKTVLFDVDDLVIDTKYTDRIPYVQALSKKEKQIYDEGVCRMGKTLRLCDAAITSTERLCTELKNYVPEVFLNRNTASERMYALSEHALKTSRRSDQEFRIGYFSGSITHNADFALILPAVRRFMETYKKVRLYLVGELDLPEMLQEFSDRITALAFMDWEELPKNIALMDVNLAPLEAGIFNEAKSENKWIEAALVKVPTVASNRGAFQKMIRQNETGILCDDPKDWYEALCTLYHHPNERKRIAKQAYDEVRKHCISLYTGYALAQYIKKKINPTAVFVLPSTNISGGILVALKHAVFLYDVGYSVTILAHQPSLEWMEAEGIRFPVVAWKEDPVLAQFDKAVATMWMTTQFTQSYPKIKDRYYLVQNFEPDMYEPDIPLRIQANGTYLLGRNTKYITISRWCQHWLLESYGQKADYAPNGIDEQKLYPVQRDFNAGKIRILIEGDSASAYKNVDESFRIANELDKSKYEVWYMSYAAQPKKWYVYDRFLHQVPYEKVADVYRQCHILLKSSLLESFSYPPMEMMATGGFVVAVQNDGNKEYLKDGYNCLIYARGHKKAAHRAIIRIVENAQLRERLEKGAKETIRGRDWNVVRKDVLQLYDVAR